jgi:hypothetical protein
MVLHVGARFVAVHSIRGLEYGTIISAPQPGELMYPFVQIRFDHTPEVMYLPRRCLRVIGS